MWSLAIEIVQQYIPLRAFEWADLLANSCGVLVGVLLARYSRHLPLITQK
jgi:glycopeptide antibiotics resistance protein